MVQGYVWSSEIQYINNWCMDFNVSKCKVMHIDRNNPKATYTMNNVILDTTVKERDISVLVQPSLRPSVASRRANAVPEVVPLQRQEALCATVHPICTPTPGVLSRPGPPGPWPTRTCWRRFSAGPSAWCEDFKVQPTRNASRSSASCTWRAGGPSSTWPRSSRSGVSMGNNPARITRNTTDPLNIMRKNPRTEIRKNFFSNRVVTSGMPYLVKLKMSTQFFRSKNEWMRCT